MLLMKAMMVNMAMMLMLIMITTLVLTMIVMKAGIRGGEKKNFKTPRSGGTIMRMLMMVVISSIN